MKGRRRGSAGGSSTRSGPKWDGRRMMAACWLGRRAAHLALCPPRPNLKIKLQKWRLVNFSGEHARARPSQITQHAPRSPKITPRSPPDPSSPSPPPTPRHTSSFTVPCCSRPIPPRSIGSTLRHGSNVGASAHHISTIKTRADSEDMRVGISKKNCDIGGWGVREDCHFRASGREGETSDRGSRCIRHRIPFWRGEDSHVAVSVLCLSESESESDSACVLLFPFLGHR